jgi:putative ATPase
MLSAINSGVKEIREIIEKASDNNLFNQNKPVLFIDEIHRFSKSQQDSLLGAVEKGTVTLIGATTENPSFEVISALLSRCQVYVMKHLDEEELVALLKKAITQDEILKTKKIELKEHEALLRISGGDARKLYNALEIVVNSQTSNEVVITNELVLKTIQQNLALYDKSGEQHYDIISAFIKSMRGSDPNAAVYYLARMLKGGEDPLFIARRMVILASEDIGNANPNALLLANACFNSVNIIGMPEARIILSQCATYLACSAKSNASYMAIGDAMELVDKSGDLPVPLHLRNAPTRLMKNMNYGKDYQYAHSFENNFVELEFLPEQIAGTKLYDPGDNAREAEQRAHLRKLWKEKYGY